jgi:hypothetical protein
MAKLACLANFVPSEAPTNSTEKLVSWRIPLAAFSTDCRQLIKEHMDDDNFERCNGCPQGQPSLRWSKW